MQIVQNTTEDFILDSSYVPSTCRANVVITTMLTAHVLLYWVGSGSETLVIDLSYFPALCGAMPQSRLGRVEDFRGGAEVETKYQLWFCHHLSEKIKKDIIHCLCSPRSIVLLVITARITMIITSSSSSTAENDMNEMRWLNTATDIETNFSAIVNQAKETQSLLPLKIELRAKSVVGRCDDHYIIYSYLILLLWDKLKGNA